MAGFKAIRGQTEPEIRRRILQAIFEQRLPPGEHLVEESLAEAFSVSRTVIRQVIARLSQDGIVVKRSNKGAYVANPSRQEVSQILHVRKIVEPEIVRSLARDVAGLSFDGLDAHLVLEDQARERGDRGTLVRLTGELHLLLAELSGNTILIRLMTELQALTCLAILLYSTDSGACPADEHRKIVELIKLGDGEGAVAVMLHHLGHVAEDLNLSQDREVASYSRALRWMSGDVMFENG